MADPPAAATPLPPQVETELRRLRTIASLLPQMVWTLSPDGGVIWISDNWFAYSGMDPADLRTDGATEGYTHPEDAPAVRASFRNSLATGQPWEAVLRLRGRDGTYRSFLSRALPLRDDAGRVMRWFGAYTDIDDQTGVVADLRESRARYKELVETLPQLVWTCRADGTCDYLSRQWVEFTGVPEGDQLGLTWLDRVIHPEDRDRTFDHWMGAVAGHHPYDIEYRIRRHDGAYVWFKVRGTPIRDERGGISHWFGTCTDIQEIVEAREVLREEAAEAGRERRRLFNGSPDLLATAGYDGLLRSINPAWSRLLGWADADLLARPFGELIHPDDREATVEQVSRLQRGEQVAAFENRVRRADNRYVRVQWTANGGEDRFYVVGRDVTEARRAGEELERAQSALRQAHKMEAIGQLTGGVAHDFNNLLTAITGNLELLQRRLARGDTDVGRFTEGALSSARRAAVLTQRLLAFSRRQALEPRLVDVNAAVLGMEELIRRSVGDHIRVIVRPSSEPLTAWCDPSQLENALLNLAINARDAMPDGGELTIAAMGEHISLIGQHPADAPPPDLEDGDYVRVSVSDTGVGMSAEVAERAFDPFFTTKPLGQGTGLGLSQLYGFARQSGGAAEIRSAPGHGATISLHLPRRAASPDAAGPPPLELAVSPKFSGRGRRVTVVEDEAMVRAAVVQALTEEGFTVEAFDAPQPALIHLEGVAACDLLVTDIGLPGLNGRNLAAAARRARPGLPVLFITGYEHEARPGADPQVEEAGCDLLRKPFAIDELSRRVAQLLERAT